MTKDILRRIAERGLRISQKRSDSDMMDLWQHMLDEIDRLGSDEKGQ